MARRLGVLAAAAAAALTLAGVAHGQTYELVSSDVQANVRPDGSVAVDEAITVAFSGSFTYGFREIPLRDGERIDEIGVTENGRPFQPGASTELEPGGPPGTFGVEDLGGRTRVVWRFTSDGLAQRTFVVHYRIAGLATGYDDVVDVNLKVWGDEWEQRLGRLTATMRGPGNVVRAWGHPVWVRGDVTIDGRTAVLRALDVDAGQFVELRALYPRDSFTSTSGMKVEEGNGLEKIVAEELDDAAAYERDKERIDDAKAHPWRSALIVLALGTIPAFLIAMFVFWRFGREIETGYDREYEQEPPTETEPALVPTLLRQGGEAGSFEFTATLFDLIRRGHYAAAHVTTERSIWGGLRSETISDLEISVREAGRAHGVGGIRSPPSSTTSSTAGACASRSSGARSRTSERRWRRDSRPSRAPCRGRSARAAGSARSGSSRSWAACSSSARSGRSSAGSRSTGGGPSIRAGATSSSWRSPSRRS